MRFGPKSVLLLVLLAAAAIASSQVGSFKYLPSTFVPTGISADGSTVIGTNSGQPAYYREQTGLTILTSTKSESPRAVTADGSVIYSFSSKWTNGVRTDNTGSVYGVSDDGTITLVNDSGLYLVTPTERISLPTAWSNHIYSPEHIVPDGSGAYGHWRDQNYGSPGGVYWSKDADPRELPDGITYVAATLHGEHFYTLQVPTEYNDVKARSLCDNGTPIVLLDPVTSDLAYCCARDNCLVSAGQAIYLPYRQALVSLIGILTEYGVSGFQDGLTKLTLLHVSGDGLVLLGRGTDVNNAVKYWVARITPHGSSDHYDIPINNAFSVATPGVLGNDVFSLGATCVLVSSTTHGSLALGPDGSFSYTPEQNFIGSDTFVYKLQKGNASSANIAVSIRVGAPASLDAPAVIASGGTGTGRVTLNFTAFKDETVKLTSSRTNVATVPASVVVPSGSNFATFPITAAALTTSANTTLSATYNGVSRTKGLMVAASSPKSLTFDATSYCGGNGVAPIGSVVLWSKAPSSGLTVNLSSSNPEVLQVPATVRIGAGYLSNTFAASTKATLSPVNVTVTASGNGSSATCTITIRKPKLKSLTFPNTIRSGSNGVVTVTLDGSWTDSANPYVVKLYLNNVLSGQDAIDQGTGNTFTQLKVPVVRYRTSINLLARCSDGTELEVLMPVETALLTGFTGRTPTIHGGLTAIADLHYDGTPDRAETVTYASSNTTVIPTPGKTGGAMAKSIPTNPVTSAADVTLSATFEGVTQSYVQRVIPAELASLSVTPTTVKGGSHLTGSISLFGVAAVNARVGLTSSNPAAIPVSASATVAMGSSAKTFDIATNPVTSETSVVLTATYRGVQKSVTITVTP